MPDHNDERKLDDLLDSALFAYSAVEPRPGLEVRVLAHLRSAPQARTRWWSNLWLVRAAAGAAVAAILFIVLFFRPVGKQVPAQVREESPATSQQPQAGVPSTVVRAPREKHRHSRQPEKELAQSDRPAIFPTPAPLSEQEKLMLAYLAQTPKEEIIAQMRRPNAEEEEEFWKDRQPAAARPQR